MGLRGLEILGFGHFLGVYLNRLLGSSLLSAISLHEFSRQLWTKSASSPHASERLCLAHPGFDLPLDVRGRTCRFLT